MLFTVRFATLIDPLGFTKMSLLTIATLPPPHAKILKKDPDVILGCHETLLSTVRCNTKLSEVRLARVFSTIVSLTSKKTNHSRSLCSGAGILFS